ncbi:AbrB/MazE/SpoVT family DNA-binding domain-containing protein [Bordetella genomosp. 1]|uniref:AbrB/MazE/SpoVT family DNA-binding domain-containing protein n=1 Tax=Bordetella genomosp. 1 TaxID=1395607 RepID=A0A261RWG7_9BORD|nr:type II toxin-antitoxin system VapB family antitoxin [Bordetella genomosp. 1]OZI29002.1 AbrB/MazE/SpoVT family DNA-binding domain-containing protein [Bordetella genomosp. 1]
MIKTTVMKRRHCQLIRLPRAAALPRGVTRVEVRVVGRTRVLVPIEDSWEEWFKSLGDDVDFPTERDQSPLPPRKIPNR